MTVEFAERFWTPYDEVHLMNGKVAKAEDLNGKGFIVLTEKDKESYDFEEVGVMYIIEFDGAVLAEAYPEEVEVEQQKAYGKRLDVRKIKETIKFKIDGEELSDIKKKSSRYGIESEEFEGVLQDNYIFYNAERIKIYGNSRKYIIVLVKYVNTWTSGLELLMTDSEEEVEKYKKILEGEI